MEEMLYKFIDEGKRKHEEMRAFIGEFRTTKELLFKERNNSLSELRFKVHELLKVIDNTPISNCEIKEVTTRGGKTRTQDVHNTNTNIHAEKPRVANHDKPIESNEVLLEDQPKKTNKPVIQPSREPKLTRMSLELADKSIQYPRRIIENVLIKVDKFFLPIDFVILDMPKDSRVPIILGRPFLATAQAMIDVFNKHITLRAEDDECYGIDDLDDTIREETQELLGNDKSDSFLLKGLEKSINQSDLESCEYLESKSDLEKPIRRIDSVNTPYSLEQGAAKPDGVLEKRKGGIAWKMSDIKGISPSYCTHKILMEDDFKPVIQPQRCLNPKVQDVVKNEIVKLLDSGFFQIPIALKDQEKKTFTCPYGTFVYRRMPFGLCNAPTTFQRCMIAIFHDMVEDFMEVFMDDFLVFGNSFNCCLANLDRMLAKYEETNLVLYWRKMSFYSKRRDCSRTQNVGIKRLLNDLEVTAAKVRVIVDKQNLVLFSNLDEKYAN
ncbi:DNA-directed DNA polymerase [Tanacetum coccineum]|uniref:DNA-directed DNA polymerase n=1 Tax=Tanacetum coccineum TaxID=301880 RepID=A0ABQ4X8J0_9ASTR